MGFQSDHHYIDKVLEGDVSAYTQLVEKHKDMVFTIANKITRHREDAEEIAQDVFLKAFQHLKEFKKQSKFSTWLYRIAFNTAISKIRKKSLEYTTLDDNMIEQIPETEIDRELKDINEQEKKQLVDKALEQLNELDYLIITMFYMKEKSIEEIAEITSLSKSNVKVKLHRIRKRIYKELYDLIGEKVRLLV
ncbi:MAG: sigma-70 family RNA polymerase sigma factor [Bacteroidota bacterium]|nr:sigma-70 family RNA polymerase sigma factor [Bacteroidota bacterium]